MNKDRIIIDNQGGIHTIPETLYQEISEAVGAQRGVTYLTHPDRLVRLVAALKLQQRQGGE